MRITNKLLIIISFITLLAVGSSCFYLYRIIADNLSNIELNRIANRNIGAFNEFKAGVEDLDKSCNVLKEWMELEDSYYGTYDKDELGLNNKIDKVEDSNLYLLNDEFGVTKYLKERYKYYNDGEFNEIIRIISQENVKKLTDFKYSGEVSTENFQYIVIIKPIRCSNPDIKYLLSIKQFSNDIYNKSISNSFSGVVSIDRIKEDELSSFKSINIGNNTAFVKYTDNNVISRIKINAIGNGTSTYLSLVEKPQVFQGVNKNLKTFLIIIAIIFILETKLIYHSIKKIVVDRMLKINSSVKKIISTFNLKIRIEEDGTDEIARLSKNLNSLFILLENYSRNMIYVSEHDIITKLFNRRRIEEIGQSYIEDNEEFSLACIDIDDFKKINDVFGHNVGDEILLKIGDRLTKYSNDYISCGRLGGDEFIILLKGENNKEKIIYVVKDIFVKFREGIYHDGVNYKLKASVGICNYPDYGENMAQILKNADIAMYNIKNNGGNNYCTFHDELLSSFKIESQIAEGLKKGRFEAYFQPIINLETNKIVGAEALIRLNNGSEIITPNRFISVAKRSGYIVPLDRLMIMEACKLIRKFLDNGIEDFKISVNVSFQLLMQKNFLSELMETIRRFNIGVKNIVLEITEHETIEEMEYIIDLLKRVRQCGIQISLDDFGTGYSSFNYIKTLPLDFLKIDNSMMYDLGGDKKSEDIIKTIVNLSHILDLTVICEGVETKEQALMLKQLKCDNIQGYYLSRPLRIDKLKEYYDKHMNIHH